MDDVSAFAPSSPSISMSSVNTKTQAKYISQSINQYYFIVRPKVDQGAGQLSLPHVEITKTESNRTKTKKSTSK